MTDVGRRTKGAGGGNRQGRQDGGFKATPKSAPIGLDSDHEDISLLSSDSSCPVTSRIAKNKSQFISIDYQLVKLLMSQDVKDWQLRKNYITELARLLQKASVVTETWSYDPSIAGLIEELGGWRPLVLKLHQLFAILSADRADHPEQERAPFKDLRCVASVETLLLYAAIRDVDDAAINYSPQSTSAQNAGGDVSEPRIFVSLEFGCWKALFADGLAKSSRKVFEWSNNKKLVAATIDLSVLTFAVAACGRYDPYMSALLCQLATGQGTGKESMGFRVPDVMLNSNMMVEAVAEHAVRIFKEGCNWHGEASKRMGAVHYEWFLLLLADGPSSDLVMDKLEDLRTILWYSTFSPLDRQALKYLEKVLVALLGHDDAQVRSKVVVMLNELYDGTDWQQSVAFNPTVAAVGSPFELEFSIDEAPENVFVVISAPATNPSCNHSTFSFHVPTWEASPNPREPTDLDAEGKPKQRWKGRLDMGIFSRCGFYDWRLVKPDLVAGNWTPINKSRRQQQQLASSLDLLTLTARGDAPSTPPDLDDDAIKSFPVQGRIVVQRSGLDAEQVHEIYIDAQDASWDEKSGDLISRGSYATVTSALEDLSNSGITTVHLTGALARDNGELRLTNRNSITSDRPDASHNAVTDRASPNAMLGGKKDFEELMREAHRVGIKILVDSTSRISSSRYHRKYRPLVLYTLDETGKKVLLYGTDGKAVTYEDTAMLNYRKVEAWDLLVSDIAVWAEEHGVSGVRLENAQAWPMIMKANMDELSRRDTDGEPHYDPQSKLDVDLVVPIERDVGYWDTPACSKGKWANPIFVKLCKELWSRFPDFVIIGECWGGEGYENRHAMLARSGVVPHLQQLPAALATLFGRHIAADGVVKEGPPHSVMALKRWYDEAHAALPPGAFVIQSSCSHSSPYPALLYGRGAWPAVDLIFCMPDIPWTMIGEMEGRSYRVDVTNVFKSDNPPPAQHGLLGAHNFGPVQRMRSVRSLVNLQGMSQASSPAQHRMSHGSDSLAPPVKPLSKVRSFHALESTTSLARLEEQHKKAVGPEYGFDLKLIRKHYDHRRAMRHKWSHLRQGHAVALKVCDAKGNALEQVFGVVRHPGNAKELAVVMINFSPHEVVAHVELKCLWKEFSDIGVDAIYEVRDMFASGEVQVDLFSLTELFATPFAIKMAPYSSIARGLSVCHDFRRKETIRRLYNASLKRLNTALKAGRSVASNFVVSKVIGAIKSPSVNELAMVLQDFHHTMTAVTASAGGAAPEVQAQQDTDASAPQLYDLFLTSPELTDKEDDLSTKLFAKLKVIAEGGVAENQSIPVKAAEHLIQMNSVGSLVFISPELGKWSTVGGLGVMVDELSCTLAELGQDVWVISPYYDRNRKGEQNYLVKDNIHYWMNVTVNTGWESVTLGIHKGECNGVKLLFMHNPIYFPGVYPDQDATSSCKFLSVFGKAPLEVLCQMRMIPSVIVTNDWASGLVPAYAKSHDHFGRTFHKTTFFHIVHNLDASYEGRIWPHRGSEVSHIFQLPDHLLVDPNWGQYVVNPSRCVLLSCDTWGTVSKSYLDDLRGCGTGPASALASLLNRYPEPFAFPNGIPIESRLKKIQSLNVEGHEHAKGMLQMKYFNFEQPDLTIPLFAFIGRITQQKGVHLILDAAENIIKRYNHKILILVGGMANYKEPYSARCAHRMWELRNRYKFNFWANPDEFFHDGTLVNIGADFALMPSLFEPGGIVQHEFFVASTPVIAFKTGGLKDTVFEYDPETNTGNGFTFESHNVGDMVYAMERAMRVFEDKPKYEKLRVNARNSTVSCEDVANAWLSEFCRLRRKIPVRWDRVQKLKDELPKWHQDDASHGKDEGRTTLAEDSSVVSPVSSVSLDLVDGHDKVDVSKHKGGSETSASSRRIVDDAEAERRREQRDAEILRRTLLKQTQAPSQGDVKPALQRKATDTKTSTAASPSSRSDVPKPQTLPVIPPASKQEAHTLERSFTVRFKPPPNMPKPRIVNISGSFDQWQQRIPLTWEISSQLWEKAMSLNPGKYHYKIIVDGVWMTNPSEPTEVDAGGHLNNVMLVQ